MHCFLQQKRWICWILCFEPLLVLYNDILAWSTLRCCGFRNIGSHPLLSSPPAGRCKLHTAEQRNGDLQGPACWRIQLALHRGSCAAKWLGCDKATWKDKPFPNIFKEIRTNKKIYYMMSKLPNQIVSTLKKNMFFRKKTTSCKSFSSALLDWFLRHFLERNGSLRLIWENLHGKK